MSNSVDHTAEMCPHRETPGICAVCRKQALNEAEKAYDRVRRQLGPQPPGELEWDWSRALLAVGIVLQVGSVGDIDDARRWLLRLKCGLMSRDAASATDAEQALVNLGEHVHERGQRRARARQRGPLDKIRDSYPGQDASAVDASQRASASTRDLLSR